MSRNAELDRLRAVAALMTVYTHYSQVFYPWTFTMQYAGPDSALDMFGNAWTGVDLFFVISGYIISKTIVNSFDNLRHSGAGVCTAVAAFYVRRIYRIYPVAWLILAGILCAAAWLNQGGYFAQVVDYLKACVSIFTYSFNYAYPDIKVAPMVPVGPYWSLAVEEQFYLFYPLFLLTIKSTRHRVIALLAALAVITLCIRPLSSGNPLHQFFYTQSRCDGLIYGCLLYFASVQPWFKPLRSMAASGGWALKATVVLIILAIATMPVVGFGNTLVIPIVCILSAILVAFSACEAGVISFPGPVRQVLDFVGCRSYTIYLIHVPLFYLTCELMHRYCQVSGLEISAALKPKYLLVFSLLMLSCTEIIYRLVERPMIRRGKQVAVRIMDPSAHPAAAGPREPPAPVL